MAWSQSAPARSSGPTTKALEQFGRSGGMATATTDDGVSRGTDATHGPGDESRVRLDAAVAVAVADGVAEARRVTEMILSAFDKCDQVVTALRKNSEDGGQHGSVNGIMKAVKTARQQSEMRLTSQAARLKTFNLVLFGRTGVGKSSLIEALSGGDGLPISQGESDWTTEIRDVRWRGCRLVDTPGIAGWGRTVDREELEKRAERAVADADVVLLCFDSYAALADEFKKTSEWIGQYGKPVVAVLNSKNAMWRSPVRAPAETTRRNLSRTVLEHADNIRQELERIGLPGVPVVAIHTQRAGFARTGDPYLGPAAPSREKQRVEFGPDRLLSWSNLPALEALLAEAMASHAKELRLTMLHEQARGVLADAISGVQREQATARAVLEPIELGIAEILKAVGRPSDPEFARRLNYLEARRPGRFHVGLSLAEGLARDLLAQRLASVKAEARDKATALVDEAFARGEEVDEATFRREVIDPVLEECERAATEVAQDVRAFVQDRVALICGDVDADLAATARTLGRVDGDAGRTGKRIGLALKIGAAGVGLAGLAAGGWVPLVAAMGASIVITAVGDKVQKDAARDRQKARSTARAASRKSIQQTFKNIENQLANQFASAIAAAAGEKLSTDVEQAIALRAVGTAADRITGVLKKVQAQVPAAGDARFVLTEVARDVQQQRFPGEPTADRLLWLGEDWCSDPEGLVEVGLSLADATSTPRRSRNSGPELTAVIDGFHAAPRAGSGRRWLDEALPTLEVDPEAAACVVGLNQILDHARPRIAVVGDYSSGKSSFIRRLLVDTGSPVPEELEVGARPKTAVMTAYPWAEGEIIDTPGFQSSHADHAERAHDALVGASLVIFLFNPNLVVGANDDLARVLLGDAAHGRPARLRRTLFVINRADELGVDPEEDPEGFEALSLRKRQELAQALAKGAGTAELGRAGITVDRIACAASDPYGLVGDSDDANRVAFDRFRSWDGMDTIVTALQALSATGSNTADLQVLEIGAAALSTMSTIRRTALAEATAALIQGGYLKVDLDACGGRGRALIEASRDELADIAVGFVAQLWDEAEAAIASKDRQVLADRLKGWESDPEFEQLYTEWATSVEQHRQEWMRQTQHRVEERLASAEFAAVFPDARVVLEVDSLTGNDGSEGPSVVGLGRKAAKQGAKQLKAIEKPAVLKVFHKFGYKFKPWGATKMTAKIAKVGAGIGVAIAVWEVYDAVQADRRQTGRERGVQAARAECLKLVRDHTNAFFSGRDDQPGAGAPLEESVVAVEQKRDNVAANLTADGAKEALLRTQIEVIDRHVIAALRHLEGEAG
jgi:predicted GTPase